MAQSKRPGFLLSEEATYIRKQLENMEQDPEYDTRPTYSANTTLYPDHMVSFSDKHMKYLETHPRVDCIYYVSNLRLITKIRQSQ